MRVVLDARIRVGGPTVYARLLAAALPVDAHVVGPRFDREPFTPWGRAAVAAAARRTAADLVHGLHLEAPPVRVPTVVTVQDLVPLDHPGSLGPIALWVWRGALDQALRRAARVIVPSPLTGDRLAAYGCDPARLAVVPLAAGPWFRPCSEEERERARRRFAGGRRYVVASTGSRPHKNLAGLVAAADRLPHDVVVAATGNRPPAGRVTFAGHLSDDDVRLLYGGAEVMVLPARVEGFGLPAVEALACGVPVVCGPSTGALAYVRAGAVEVDVTRPEALAAGVRSLLGDGGLRSRLAAAGREAASGLTVDAMASATVAVYQAACG